MDFRRVMGVGLLLALPFAATGKPIYLKCQNEGAPKAFDVTVDEETSKVSQTLKPVMDAQFTPTAINYEKVDRGVYSYTSERFTINRQTLEMITVWSVGSNDGSGKVREVRTAAKCEVVEAPERKI